MNTHRERPPLSTISGTMMRLSERDTIAIYRWDELSWVAHFRDGYGELSDAATWFRVHAGLLRSYRVGSLAALETVETLTPEMISRIARLHQWTDAQLSRQPAAVIALSSAFRWTCARIASALHGLTDRLLHRVG